MVLLEFSISPTGKGESLSPYISRVLKTIDDSGVSYRLTPMGTTGSACGPGSTLAVLAGVTPDADRAY